MKRNAIWTAAVALSLSAAPVLAQDAPTGQPLGESVPAQGSQLDDGLPNGTEPPSAAPTQVPQMPERVPEPQQVQGYAVEPVTAPVLAPPQGQWVYTAQYGWVWAPYAQAYTYVAPDANVAQMYVFRVGIGWGWVLSPWVFGIGPVPYWGTYGYNHFAWYCRPWFHAWYGPRPSLAWGHFYGRYGGPIAPYRGNYGHGYGGYHGPTYQRPIYHGPVHNSPVLHNGGWSAGPRPVGGGRIGGPTAIHHGGGHVGGGGMRFGGHHR